MISLQPAKTIASSRGRSSVAFSSWRLALLLSAAALAFGVLLGGLSIWFLGSVAIAGLSAAALTFNFHIPAALIRMFAIGRTVTKYGERLVGHRAALLDQTARRVALFGSMASAPSIRRAGWQLGNPERLADYLDDVEDVDYGRLRVDLPVLTAGTGLIIAMGATLFVAPLATLPILLAALCLIGIARQLASKGAVELQHVRDDRREGGERLGAAMAAIVPLQAERRWASQSRSALELFTRADERQLSIRLWQAGFDAAASALGPIAAISVLAVAWIAGARAEGLLLPAFLSFSWIALGEMMQGCSRIVLADLRRRAAERQITDTAPARSQDVAPVRRSEDRPAELRLTGWVRRAPDGRGIGQPITLYFEAGMPTILVGASGCGKTSLLKQVAGWIGDDIALGEATSLTPTDRTALSFLCPHDAAVLDDTIRANLFAPHTRDEDLMTALSAVELDERVRAAGGLDSWISQDRLSLGEAQRLNLARAWLTDRPIVLLDEPTEHVDDAQGERVLRRLLDRLTDRIVVLSSHHFAEMPGAQTIRL